MSSLHDFATWEPLLRLLRAAHAERLAVPGGHVAGRIGRGSWSMPLRRGSLRAMLTSGVPMPDSREEFTATNRVRQALVPARVDDIAFTVEIAPSGRTVLQLFDYGPAAEPGSGSAHPGALILTEGAVPEPWRRLPEAVPDARPAPSVDLALLERTLRGRIPGENGATEEEIPAAEASLGVALPEEIKVLYRVTHARWQDWRNDYEAKSRVFAAVGFELGALNSLAIADASERALPWKYAAMEVALTSPDAAVQDLVVSPGWIVIGDTGGGNRIAVDLTPGPRGHTGQIIVLDHEQSIGAHLLAESLTDLVLHPDRDREPRRRRNLHPLPFVASVHHQNHVEAAVHPDLEVLGIGAQDGEPFSLAPFYGLPRLRTLSAHPGALPDPLEIAELTGLEFLELAPQDRRVLLDADAVPHDLSAAAIRVHGDRDPARSSPWPTRSSPSETAPSSQRPSSTAASAPCHSPAADQQQEPAGSCHPPRYNRRQPGVTGQRHHPSPPTRHQPSPHPSLTSTSQDTNH